jgi:cytochrome c556
MRFKEFRMRRFLCAASLTVFMVMACLAAGAASARDDDEQTPTIKAIMEKLHTGKKSPLNTVKTALKANSPNWEELQTQAKLFKKYGDSLEKNDPPRGKKDAYAKLAKAYAASAKSLEEAAERENLKGARDAFKKITNSCTTCHKSHKKN